MCALRLAVACAAAAVALCLLASGEGEAAGGAPAVGPRGPVGPAVPLRAAEERRLAKCVVVDGRTAEAVQAACDRAAKEGLPAVRLPAGEYRFEGAVRVPRGLTVLGEGPGTIVRAGDKSTHLFEVTGDRVRLTRLRMEGADTSRGEENDTYGVTAEGRQQVRVDHCELLGFSYATQFSGQGLVQVDHCAIHHNLRDGLGYGVAIYSGAHVLVTDNDFSQNRHSLASNGALDWSSGERLGRYTHVAGVRKTHWEFVHNRVGGNDLSTYELAAVDTHPGMDGTFVVEGNIFDGVRHGIGIRDGSGTIRDNLFRNLRTVTAFRPLVAISIGSTPHNGIPVEGAMPHDIQIMGNVFEGEFDTWRAAGSEHRRAARYDIGEAENITIDGALVPATRKDRPAPAPIRRLKEMREEG